MRKEAGKPGLERINPALLALVVPIGSLREDPTNTRRHGEQNLAAIAESLVAAGALLVIFLVAWGLVGVGWLARSCAGGP